MGESKLFVYGTLKSNHGNNGLLRHSTLLGKAVTQAKFGLYRNGIPYMVDDEEKVNVIGELYKITDITLARCDGLEGHPDFYTRKKIKVKLGEESHVAWCYINNNIDRRKAIHLDDGEYK